MKKVAIITGGSRGIGKGVACELLDHGYECILIAKDKKRLDETAKELCEKFPLRSIVVKSVDVTNQALVNEAVSEIIKTFGRIDVVFNNAGVYDTGSLELEIEKFERIMQVNYFGAANVARAVLPQLNKQKSGFLINLSSVCGKVGFAGTGAYSGSKFALLGLNDSLFREYAGTGVKICAISPSWVNTDMAKGRAPCADEEMIQPEDIAKTVRYLLSLSKNACPKEIVVECLKDPL